MAVIYSGGFAMTTAPAHSDSDFSADREDWEAAVIRTAHQFTVFIPGDPGVRADYDTLRDALIAVVRVTRAQPQRGARALVYAVTESGRSVVVSRPDWVRRLRERGEAADQRGEGNA